MWKIQPDTAYSPECGVVINIVNHRGERVCQIPWMNDKEKQKRLADMIVDCVNERQGDFYIKPTQRGSTAWNKGLRYVILNRMDWDDRGCVTNFYQTLEKAEEALAELEGDLL